MEKRGEVVMYVRLSVVTKFALVAVLLMLPSSAAASLSDNRAYEFVSPIEKGGLSFLSNLAVTDAAGEHAVVSGGSRNSLLSSGVSWMLETRTPTGWHGVQVGPGPSKEANFITQSHVSFNGVSNDFSQFAFQTWMPLDPRAGSGMAEYVRTGPTGPFIWKTGPPAPNVPVSNPSECEAGLEPFFCTTNEAVFAGASSNLTDVVWGQYHPLVAPPASLAGSPVDTHEAGYEVYESVNGVAELTGVVPASSAHECGPSVGSCHVPPCGAAMGNAGGAPYGQGFAPVEGAVSGDGSQVIFTSPDPVPYQETVPGCAPPEIYVREDGRITLQASASQKSGGDPNGSQEKVYAGSSAEGGRINTVFFISKEELTEDANTGGVDEGDDLYAYTMPTSSQAGELKDLTPNNNAPGPNGVAEVTFIGASTSGELVYFTASSELTTEPNSRGQTAKPGVSNLYVYDVSTGHTAFIGSGTGLKSRHVGMFYGFGSAGRLTSEVTPDGEHLVFVSSERLTAYNNFGSECLGEAVNGLPVREPGPCAEVYLYTAATGSLNCVSCNPSGAPPTGSARLPERYVEGFFDNLLEPGTLPLPRAVSDDGSRVFFSSPDRVTAEAPPPTTTRGPQAPIAINWEYEPNVYEYEKGSVHLIAPAAVLVTATPSGHDVFFDTFSQLVPQDKDGSPDIYDARIDGGFPALAPPACSGSACQGTPAAPAVFAVPPTATFTGTGNYPPVPKPPVVKPIPKHCKKGFELLKKKHKCVKNSKGKRATRGRATAGANHGKGRA